MAEFERRKKRQWITDYGFRIKGRPIIKKDDEV
jgi:hypothetical protein